MQIQVHSNTEEITKQFEFRCCFFYMFSLKTYHKDLNEPVCMQNPF